MIIKRRNENVILLRNTKIQLQKKKMNVLWKITANLITHAITDAIT